MMINLRRRLFAALHNPLTAALTALAAVALIGGLTYVLTSGGGGAKVPAAVAQGFAVSPAGERVPRLSPIVVSFEKAPSERRAEKLLQLEPAAEGDYTWVNGNTLLFQPKFPGLLRGQVYAVTVAARPEAGLTQEYRTSFTTDEALTVESVVPAAGDVEVPAKGQILVQFSRSVAPLTLLSEQSTRPVIEFEPALAGKGEWLNTSLYRFIPEAIAPNTHYRARVAAGLTSAADGVLKEDYRWEFDTYGPALASVTPDANTLYASLKQVVTLTFNQPMDRASVQAGFQLLEASGGTVAGSFAWSKGDTVAAFTPTSGLKQAATYTAVVGKGLKGAHGGETKDARQVAFTTVGTPRVRETDPANGATSAGRYGVRVAFTNPMDMDSLEGRVSISGFTREEIEQAFYSDEMTLYVGVSLKPSTAYTVSIAAGATDRYGQPLAPYTFSFRTGARQPSLSFAVPNAIATYSASTEPLLYFHTTNMTRASFTLYPLTTAEAELLRSRNYIPHDRELDFKPSLPPLRSWTVDVSGKPDEVLVNTTSLSGGGPLPRGDYYVLSGTAELKQFNSELAFTVVDTAIVTKESQDELLAWVLDLDSGTPVAGAIVTAKGTGLAGSGTATTDAQGLASFALVDRQANFPPGGRNLLLRVDGGGRLGVSSTQWQQGSQPWQLNIPVEYYSRKYVGYLYAERPIYRPGEEVFFKGIVRQDDDADYHVPEARPGIEAVLRDAQGKELLRQALTLNEFGTFALSFQLPGNADTGDYGVSLEWTPSSQYHIPVAGTSFLVAEFRRPEFEVTVQAGSDAYVSGDSIDATAAAGFFFGGTLSGAAVEWSAISSPFFLRAPGFEQYSFADTDFFRYDIINRSVIRDPVRARGTAVTGADGTAAIAVPAEIKGDEGAQTYTVSATVTDQNGQAVAGSTNVTVHPASLYAGIRPADYLASAGAESGIDLLTVDTHGRVLPGRAVTVKVYERKWVTTKEQTPEGARRYRSEPVDTLLQTIPATTDSKGLARVSVRPEHAGTLRLVAEVTDERGRTARSATYLWVSSGEYASWYVSNDDTFRLIADRNQYEVGDTAEVLVPAPFAGATGLVTIERGKIHSRTVQAFPTNSTRLSIPVTDRSVPNVFVSTVLYRPPTRDDPVPRYKIGYVELPVSTKTRALQVAIQPDRQQAKPGETVRYDIRVTDWQGKGVRAELSVAVVDKAVLSLADDRNPDGLLAFWFERGLGVATGSSLAVSINRSNDVISEPRQGGKGGGGLDDDRLRQDFRNTAFWKAQVTTAADGTASVEVPLPDNLTTWRMQVRAVSGAAMIGEGTNELLATQPLLLRPALPRFLRVGDKATIRLLARNATPNGMDVSVALAAEGVEVSGDLTKKARVEPGQSAMLEWPATVTAEGTARLTFNATSSAGLKDAVRQELPVALDVTPETMATGGVVKDRTLYEALYLPIYAILNGGKLEVNVQPTLTGVLSDELRYFEPPRPYYEESTDAIAARILATLAISRAEKSGAGGPDRSGRVQSDLADLVARQATDGGWKWCTRCSGPSDPWLTGSALLAIGEARRDGRSFDFGMLARATAFMEAYLNRSLDVAHPADPNDKAFVLAALASAADPQLQLPTMRALFEQYRAKLTNAGRAYLLLAMSAAGLKSTDGQVQALLNDLAGAVVPSANGNHWEDGPETAARGRGFVPPSPAVRTTALVLHALVRVQPNHPLIEETVRWLMVARGTQAWQVGLDRAEALLALSEFAAGTGELAGDFNYRVLAGERELLSGQFAPAKAVKKESQTVALTTFQKGTMTNIAFLRDFARPGRLYYTLNLRYLTPAKEVEAVSRGISVSHRYSALGDDGKAITQAKVGEVVRVTVTVVAPAERDYVVVDDLLPAGLEPIDPQLKTTDPALAAKLQVDREASRPADARYYAPWFGWYWSPFDQVVTRDDRVTLRARKLPQGVHEFVYYARATTPGDFFVTPAHAEESFFPEVFGRSDSGRFGIAP